MTPIFWRLFNFLSLLTFYKVIIMAFQKGHKTNVGRVAWNKNMTKETNENIRRQGEEHSRRMKHLIKEGKLKTYFMLNKTGESPIKKDCPVCKRNFTTFKSQDHDFCSQECYWKDKKGKHASPDTEFKKGNISWTKGKHRTKEEIAKMVETKKKLYAEGKIKSWNKGLTKDTDERVRKLHEKQAKTMRKLYAEGKIKPNSGTFKKGRKLNEESERKRFENQHMRPTRPEKLLDSLLQQNFPNEYKYTGDGKVVINGRNPDFLNCNGQKKAILLNGVYWHLTRLQKVNQNLTRGEVEINERKPYDEFGFKLLHIWEDELKNADSVIDKIKDFNGV